MHFYLVRERQIEAKREKEATRKGKRSREKEKEKPREREGEREIDRPRSMSSTRDMVMIKRGITDNGQLSKRSECDRGGDRKQCLLASTLTNNLIKDKSCQATG